MYNTITRAPFFLPIKSSQKWSNWPACCCVTAHEDDRQPSPTFPRPRAMLLLLTVDGSHKSLTKSSWVPARPAVFSPIGSPTILIVVFYCWKLGRRTPCWAALCSSGRFTCRQPSPTTSATIGNEKTIFLKNRAFLPCLIWSVKFASSSKFFRK